MPKFRWVWVGVASSKKLRQGAYASSRANLADVGAHRHGS